MSRQECQGCDMARGVICDDCLELLERKLDASDVIGGVFGCLLVAAFVVFVGVVFFGWR